MSVLEELNEAQLATVRTGNGPVLIVAGPGTGKTKTLTARIAYLLEQGAKPSEIIALTFTNEAAREMRERLRAMLPGEKLPKICTFHALGHDLLKSERKLIKSNEQAEIIRALKRPQVFKGLSLRELTLVISRAKTSITDSGDLSFQRRLESSKKGIAEGAVSDWIPGQARNDNDRAVAQLLQSYEAVLVEQGVHDYDDLLRKSYELLQSDESRRPNYTYVLIDEFQDTSELQYELLKLLGAGENIFAIGDPNQSIYGWRGAGAEMFGRFRTDFPRVKEIALTENYRSRPEIIALANAIFPDSPQLVAQAKEAGIVHALQTLNEYSEAAYIIGEIEKATGGSSFLNAQAEDDGRQPRDYAVLYRTHQAGKALQKAFSESGVPYQIAGEGSPYERPEVQALISELREVENPGKLSVCDLAKQLAESQDLPSENLQPFFGALVQFGADKAAALKHIDDIAEQEFYDPSVNAVTLMTIHASKGLEFEHVFLCATEDDILPKRSSENVDEERRLFYVAATRAKETLEITHTKTRGGDATKPSRFVTELPETILPRTTDPNMAALEKRLQKRQQKRAQTSLF